METREAGMHAGPPVPIPISVHRPMCLVPPCIARWMPLLVSVVCFHNFQHPLEAQGDEEKIYKIK
jgi:hypothetical protein